MTKKFQFPEKVRAGFFFIPNGYVGLILPDSYLLGGWPNLKGNAPKVLLAILSHARKGSRGAYPSQERIAGLCGITRQTARNAIRELEEKNVFAIEKVPTDPTTKMWTPS